jgi:hypothetical protein
VRTRSLLWYLHAAEVQPSGRATPSRRGPDMVLHEARYGKSVAQLLIRTASTCVWTPPRENQINVDLGLL